MEKNWGHVGLSCGEGRVIHAWGEVREDNYLSVEQLGGAAGWVSPCYLGWTAVERIMEGHRKREDKETRGQRDT